MIILRSQNKISLIESLYIYAPWLKIVLFDTLAQIDIELSICHMSAKETYDLYGNMGWVLCLNGANLFYYQGW